MNRFCHEYSSFSGICLRLTNMELASVTKILIDQLVIHADCTVFHVYITPCQASNFCISSPMAAVLSHSVFFLATSADTMPAMVRTQDNTVFSSRSLSTYGSLQSAQRKSWRSWPRKNLQSLCFCLLKIWSNGTPGNGSLYNAIPRYFCCFLYLMIFHI